ncbi:MAG: DUF4198 domain-containing protein [Deltaproteobacteria bacterium]|nr:DUF4198 domain-containing protein [Deltaproteobacteria bacterium]
MLKTKSIIFATAFALITCTSDTYAHYLWLERDGQGSAKAYFGEWVDDLHEKAGGILDRFNKPRVYLGGSTESLPIAKRNDGFDIQVQGAGDLRMIDDSIAPRPDNEKGGTTKTIYYAKAGRTESTAKMDLELVPAKANGNDFKLLLREAPLAKIEITVYGPPKWEKKLTTDDQGRITVPTPWQGRYVIEIIYFENKPGSDGEAKYDRARHISTVSFTTNSGIAWRPTLK